MRVTSASLPNFEVLQTVFDFVAPPATQRTKLTPFQEFVLTLIKLRLDLPFQDIAYRFGLSVTTVSRIFSKWLTMYYGCTAQMFDYVV